MISSIQIQNFQSHKDTRLDLHDGVNIIVGASDSGKSAIVRALKWLVWNKPGGEAFRSNWGGDTDVSVELKGGDIVSRLRAAKANAYVLNGMGFKAFGAEPPEEVSKILNLGEVNLQQQLDGPFLLDATPGQVAQYLNSVAHLDTIDAAISNIGKWTREIESRVKHLEETREARENDLKGFAYLDDMENTVAEAEALNLRIEVQKKRGEDLSTFVDAVYEVEDKLGRLSTLTRLSAPLNAILEGFEKQKAANRRLEELEILLDKIDKADKPLKKLDALRSVSEDVTHALFTTTDLKLIRTRAEAIGSLLSKITQNATAIKNTESSIRSLRKQFHDNIGDTCPLCGNPTR